MELIFTGVLFSLGVAILIGIHLCIIGRAFRGRFGVENNAAAVERSGSSQRENMSRDELGKLPCFDYKGEDKEEGAIECAVCLESFKNGDKCRLLPNCSHCFHVQCIDSWLMKTAFCPVCRTSAGGIAKQF